MSLRNLENQIGQLAIALSNRPHVSLPSNIEDLMREGKEHCKVINLRSRKGVDILVGMPKRIIEPIPTEEDTQIEKEPQQTIPQYTDKGSQATTTAEIHDSVLVKEEDAAPTMTNHNRSKEKQHAQSVVA